MAFVFDVGLNLVNNLINLMLSEGRKLSLRRQHIKRFNQAFTVAHETKQLDILVSALDPNMIRFDLIQILQPFMQPYFSMFGRPEEVLALYDLTSDKKVFYIFS